MATMLFSLIVAAAAMSCIAWLIAEFYAARGVRILFGMSTVIFVCLAAVGFQIGQRLNFNAWYGFASKELIDNIIVQLEAGKVENLLPKLKTLQAQFSPTYETRAHYDERIEAFVQDLKSADDPD